MCLLQTEASESGVGTCALKEDRDMARSRRESNDSFVSRMQWRKPILGSKWQGRNNLLKHNSLTSDLL